MGLSPLLTGAVAAVVAAVATPIVMRIARHTGVMDHPGPLKPHAAPVPYLGGVAVLLGAAAALAPSPRPAVLVPLLAALLLGVVDDVTSLPVLPRFVAELAIGAAVAWSVGVDVSFVTACVVLGTVALINAVNFVDGIDALAAGVSAVSFVGFAVVLPAPWAPCAAGLAGAAAGFLLFNRPPARIYLGDAGSYLLGTALAIVVTATMLRAGAGAPRETAATVDVFGQLIAPRDLLLVIPLVGYPVVEAVSTVARRLLTNRPLFAGDRDHSYDRLMQRGRSGPAAAAILIGAQAAVVLLAVAADRLDTIVPAAVVAASVVIATVAVARPSGEATGG